MKFTRQFFLLGLLMLAASCQAAIGQDAGNLPQRVGEIAETNTASDNFSGAVLLAKNGQIIYEKSFGFAEREKRLAFNLQTASNVASIGKVFTAVLVLQLVEEKKLALSDSIKKILPQTKIPNAEKITVQNLLMHTSGLGDCLAHPNVAKLPKDKVEIDEFIRLVEEQPLVFDEPGTRFQYSNSGFIVLGKIVEQVTGKKYRDVLAEKITRPLALKNTFFELDRTSMRLAKGYAKASEKDDWKLADSFLLAASPAGGMFSTPKDLYTFSQALFGGKLLRPETLSMMQKRQIEMVQPGFGKMNYGYGLMIRDYPNNRFSVGHNGGTSGYNAELQQYSVGRDIFTLIITSNTERRVRKMLFDIQAEFLKETEERLTDD